MIATTVEDRSFFFFSSLTRLLEAGRRRIPDGEMEDGGSFYFLRLAG
jgi:hypothetical protein